MRRHPCKTGEGSNPCGGSCTFVGMDPGSASIARQRLEERSPTFLAESKQSQPKWSSDPCRIDLTDFRGSHTAGWNYGQMSPDRLQVPELDLDSQLSKIRGFVLTACSNWRCASALVAASASRRACSASFASKSLMFAIFSSRKSMLLFRRSLKTFLYPSFSIFANLSNPSSFSSGESPEPNSESLNRSSCI